MFLLNFQGQPPQAGRHVRARGGERGADARRPVAELRHQDLVVCVVPMRYLIRNMCLHTYLGEYKTSTT